MTFAGNTVEVSEVGIGDTVRFGGFCCSRGSAVMTVHMAVSCDGNLSKKILA